MPYFFLALLFFTPWSLADEPVLRPSAQLIFKKPQLLQTGHCVAYREGGSGWIMTEPVFHLTGKVVSAEIQNRELKQCPEIPGKTRQQFNREEFVRYAQAYPCLASGEPPRQSQIGVVRLQVSTWETPHARQFANTSRLYRGMFLAHPLRAGLEIELEADLLSECNL